MDFGAGMSLLPQAIKPAVQRAGVSPVRVLGQQPLSLCMAPGSWALWWQSCGGWELPFPLPTGNGYFPHPHRALKSFTLRA